MKETTTIRKLRIIELDESDIIAMIRDKFNLPPFADVEFETRNDNFYGASVRIETEEVEPSAAPDTLSPRRA